MQLSRFVATYRDAFPGEHVLYDVMSDRYVGVDGAMLQSIASWRDAPPSTLSEREAQQAFAEIGFLVEDRAADDARLEAHLLAAAEGMPGTTYVTLMPTLACNLACTYCFQKDHPGAGRMSAETEAETIAWILRRVDAAATPRLVVHFIGGEPLTRGDQVLRIARALSAEMASRGGAFEWELTTNGVGLRAVFVRGLRACGPGSLKLTLDGDRATHDAARVHRDGRGSFDEVFAALIEVASGCGDVKLRVGGNFRPGQEASYERLLDRMEVAGLKGRIDEIRFKPVIDTSAGCAGCAPAGETEALVAIGRSVERRGIAKRTIGTVDALAPCELHWKNAYVIDPEGRVFKCLEVAGRPELALGSVRDGALGPDPLTASRPWKACRDCAYLPVCVGGCLGGRYLQSGRTGEILCRIEQFEKAFREEVVRRYLAEFHSEPAKKAA